MPDGTPVCPRCGCGLMDGFTPMRKVCHDCLTCGGRLVTLPVLQDGLGAMTHESFSFAVLALAGCVAVGGWLGKRQRK